MVPLETGVVAAMERVIVVGASGTIGAAIVELLAERYDLIRASRTSGDIHVDATSASSVADLFQRVGPYDGLITVFGTGLVGAIEDIDDAGYEESFRAKTLSQIRLVRCGLETIRDGGSFTLSSGILSQEPRPGFSAIAMANGAVESFCRSASVELPRRLRINCVTPVFMTETLSRAGVSGDGYPTLSVADTAPAYVRALQGSFTGRVMDARAPEAWAD